MIINLDDIAGVDIDSVTILIDGILYQLAGPNTFETFSGDKRRINGAFIEF